MTTTELRIDDDGDRMELELVDGTALDLPSDATRKEAAAVASAIGVHLHDRRRAAAAAAASADDGPDPADRWTLAGRYGVGTRQELPREVSRGEEWKMAGRVRDRR